MPAPVCGKCGRPHYNFEPHATAPVSTAPGHIVYRPREGYRDRADLLNQGTVRMGQTTFARRREQGERHGGFRPAA